MNHDKSTQDIACSQDTISFALLPEGLVVVRVIGRGSFKNSIEIKELAQAMNDQPDRPDAKFVFDMHQTISMDSTFMGVLASVALKQLRATGTQLIVANANTQNVRLLDTLGLTQFITVRADESTITQSDDFHPVDHVDLPRVDRIVHMIEAHNQLCDADPTNNMRFESVLKYLRESLTKDDE